MKDYTIAQLCELYKTDLNEYFSLENYYSYQSTVLKEEFIETLYESLTKSLIQRELNYFTKNIITQLRKFGYIAYFTNSLHAYDTEFQLLIFNTRIVETSKTYGEIFPTVFCSGNKVEGLALNKYDGNTRFEYVFNTGVLKEDMHPLERSEVAHSIRNFYSSDFYKNTFIPELEALKLSWLVPENNNTNKKNKNKI